ncbi:hypothetical protein DV711_08275 [Motiliproteus coralliicola]|uniref:Uncharacterized protein n=1 Tax=Motiliproteus coralliicola TaxID=2283196 RepID=A0A369WLN7_9GAMM|nr:hypothetical protein [Motiliproteus coralliicola]RDE22577.1 hypothetical protein DV711_08275 [Motiliproteus coralliicola]
MLNVDAIYENLNSSIDSIKGDGLDHQYHYGCLLLSAVLLNKPIEKWLFLIDQQVNSLVKYGTSDFVIESLTIAYEYKKETRILKLIDRIQGSCSYKLPKYAAMDYKYLYFINNGQFDNINKEVFYDKKSGLVFDSVGINGLGVPDLVYHCRNIEILIKADIPELKDIINRGVSFILSIISEGSGGLFFGRSQNSAYGYASLYYILCTLEVNDEVLKKKIELHKDDIERILTNYIITGDCVGLNIAASNGRVACDSYMYQHVYASFFLSRYLLVEKGHFKPFLFKYVDINFENYFQFEAISNDAKLVKLTNSIPYQSKIYPNDHRYKIKLQAMITPEREISFVPYFSNAITPFDSPFQKIKNKIFHKIFSFLYSKFGYLYGLFGKRYSINVGDDPSCSFFINEHKIYLRPYVGSSRFFGFIPVKLTDLIGDNMAVLCKFRVPTSTGLELYAVVMIWRCNEIS